MSYQLQTDKKSKYYRKGRTQPISEIVIHHWGAEGKTTFDRLVTWLTRADQRSTSPHYVVERGRVARLVDEADTAFHVATKNGVNVNARSIGIECRPEATIEDYQTVAQLVADIWRRHGKLPIRQHKDYNNTPCAGKWDPARLTKLAEEYYAPKQVTGTGSAAGSSTGKLYRVQVGAFSVKSNADKFLAEVKKHYPNAFIKEG